MKRFIVICGPGAMLPEEIQEKYDASFVHALVLFPESDMGAESVRELTKSYLDSDIPVYFITRYDMGINSLGEAIETGKISSEDVVIHLLDGGEWKEFYIEPEGWISDGWPYGVIS